MSPRRLSATAGVALAAFVVIVWSATFVNTKALLADFSALEILGIRFALAWVALWAIHPHGMGLLRLRDEALFAGAGLAGATAYQMLENAWNKACERLGTVRCSLGLYLVPVVAFLVAHVFLGETLPAAGVVGGLLVLAGVAVASSARRR